jgi:hypothetical protein
MKRRDSQRQVCEGIGIFLVLAAAAVILVLAGQRAEAGGVAGGARLIQLTADAKEQTYADIWGNVVVWQQSESAEPPYPSNIYAIHLDTGQAEQITGPTPAPYGNSRPTVYENLVVWSGCCRDPNENVDIWLYNLDTDEMRRLSKEPHWQYYPRIWDRYVVWQDYRNMPPHPWDPPNHDIFGCDLETGIEFSICTDTADDLWPDVWENFVVYQSQKGSVTKYDIYVYDINTGLETRITDGNDYDAWEPRINNGKVTWFGGSMSQAEITVQDIETGQRWRSGLANWNEFDPRIWDDRVVWRSGAHWPDPYWVLREAKAAPDALIGDIGWMGNCYSQEGHNIYKSLTVWCQLSGPTEENSQWDVWLACSPSDLNCDGEVDFLDFARIADNWLQ